MMGKPTGPHKKWDKKEIEYLKSHFSDSSNDDLARILNTSISSLKHKAYGLHLLKSPDFGFRNDVRKRNQEIPGYTSYRVKYIACRTTAKIKEREFALDFKYWIDLVTKNCHYCNAPPKRFNAFEEGVRIWNKKLHPEGTEFSTIFVNGVDRFDSSKGYTTENSVPCCRTCNVAKLDNSYQEFMDWIDKVVAHRAKS